MKIFKRTLALLLCLIAAVGMMLPAAAEETIVASGRCGSNLNWSLTDDGTLKITGSGSMYDYVPASGVGNSQPWESYRAQIRRLDIAEGVTSIGNTAFYRCSNITGVLYLPESLKRIGQNAFYECVGLTGDLILPDEITVIDGYAFFHCSGLSGTLHLPEKLTVIGGAAFDSCAGLCGELMIPDKVESIGAYAFHKCSGFSGDLVIPDSVKRIGDGSSTSYVFFGCSGLTGTLTLGNRLESIEGYAFYGCQFSGDLHIPDSVTFIGKRAFNGCRLFDGVLTISNRLETINEGVFAGCSNCVGELVIPESVKTIHNYAFSNCSKLSGEIAIPDSVTHIGSYAFFSCGFSGDLVIPETVETVGDNAFAYNEKLDGTLTIESVETEIGTDVFHACAGENDIIAFFANHPEYIEVQIDSEIPATPDCNGSVTKTVYCTDACHTNAGQRMLKTFTEETVFESIPVREIILDETMNGMTLPLGGTAEILVSVSPIDATNQEVIFSSSDANVIAVDADGVMTAVATGVAQITVATVDASGVSDSFVVTAYDIDVPNEINFVVGETTACCAVFTPAVEKQLTYFSSEVEVFEVDVNGMLTAISAGTANLIVSDGIIEKMIPVTVSVIPVTDLVISEADDLALLTDTEKQLTVRTVPENATNQNLVFTSSDPSVAEVDSDGVVTAVAPGYADVSVRTADGSDIERTIPVTVYSINMPSSVSLLAGKEKNADILMYPADAVAISITVEDPTIAESRAGSVYGKRAGTTNLIVTDGTQTWTIPVTVTELNAVETNDTIRVSLSSPGCGYLIKSVSYSSSDLSVVEVDENGKITRSGRGNTVVTVTTVLADDAGEEIVITKTLTVQGDNSWRCSRCDWYDANRDKDGIHGFIVWMIHSITHLVQQIKSMT